MNSIERFAEAGIYGAIFEAMKYKKATKNTIKLGGDHVYPIELLKEHFYTIKKLANNLGLKMFAGENRLRQFGDDLCCCGINGMGWQYHKANLNHHLFDPDGATLTDGCDKCTHLAKLRQDTQSVNFFSKTPFSEALELASKDKKMVEQLLPIK